MKDKDLLAAFLAVSQGFSPDRVVADPTLNDRFLHECRTAGLSAPDDELNRRLLNLRKASALGRGITVQRTAFPDASDYEFASEIAIRFLERRDGVTLDQVICDPARAAEFDQVATRICPGFSPLEYRWAALRLRKKRKLRPERLAQVCRPVSVINVPVSGIDTTKVPTSPGLYIFYETSAVLYVGESTNLRKRITKHLDHSDNKGLARWLWEAGTDSLHVELQLLPPGTATKVRKALEAELIDSRRPVFNVAGK